MLHMHAPRYKCKQNEEEACTECQLKSELLTVFTGT